MAHIASPRRIDTEWVPFDTYLALSQRDEVYLVFLILTDLRDGLDGLGALVEVVVSTEQVLNRLLVRDR